MANTASERSATAAEASLVRLSELAADKVREFIAAEGLEEAALRVSVLPGGCSGFEYGLDIETDVRDDDVSFEQRGIRIVVDPFSAQYLSGVAIGYESSFKGSGFTFENPNATGSCGCGTSFAV